MNRIMDQLGFGEIDAGHNHAPTGQLLNGQALRTLLEGANEAIRDRCDTLLNAEGRLPLIDGDEAAGKVSDFIKQITATCKTADGVRISTKEPYLEGGRVVDGFFTKGITDPLMAMKRRVEAKLTRYLQDKAERERRERQERERIARAEEERARKEAAEAAAAVRTDEELDDAIAANDRSLQATAERLKAQGETNAKPADLSRTRGDYGSVASLRTAWDYEVSDLAAIPRAFLLVNEAAVRAHIKARLKDQPPAAMPGIRFFEKTSAAVR